MYDEPRFEMWLPVPESFPDLWTVASSPAYATSLRALEKRRISPTSPMIAAATNRFFASRFLKDSLNCVLKCLNLLFDELDLFEKQLEFQRERVNCAGVWSKTA
jgi:hypothetical protein